MLWTQQSVNAAPRALQLIVAERSLEMGSMYAVQAFR